MTKSKFNASEAARITDVLGKRSIVLIGLMGAGKTTIGRRLAVAMSLPFVDADNAIEDAAGMTIAEVFDHHGEAHFRDGERKVIARLLNNGPQVLSTGGGAYIDEQTRQSLAGTGITVWLRADLDLLVDRTARRNTRPLLKNDPRGTLRRLIDERHPTYGLADITVDSRDVPHEVMVCEILERLTDFLFASASPMSNPQ